MHPTPPRPFSHRIDFSSRRGLTLIEILVALGVVTLLAGGVFGALIQCRKLTEGSIFQNSANTIMQGYVEQIKNMEFKDLPYLQSSGTVVAGSDTSNPTRLMTRSATLVASADDPSTLVNQADPLFISSVTTIPDPKTILKAATPTGVVENIKTFDVNNTPGNTADDLRLRIWVWIRDLTDSSTDATQVRGITIIYSWRTNGIPDARSFVGTVRTIRSSVPTF